MFFFFDNHGYLYDRPTYYDDYNRTIYRISMFGSEQPGWHYGSGYPASITTMNRAKYVLSYLRRIGIEEYDAFHSPKGEIAVTGYEGPHYLEIIVELDYTYTLCYEYNKATQYEKENLTIRKLKQELHNLVRGIWNSYVSSTQRIMTRGRSGSTAWRSEIQQITGYRLLTQSAPKNVMNTYVDTYESTTKKGTWENRLISLE